MEKKNYEEIMELLPQDTRDEIISIKAFIKTLKNIKLKQKIIISDNEYPYQIAFTSDYGFSYNVIIKKDISEIKNRIYLIAYNAHSQQRKFGVRKKNYFIEALDKISEATPELADELFDKIKICRGDKCYSPNGCLHGIVLSYKNKIKRTCSASFEYGSEPKDFSIVKILLKALDDVYGIPSKKDFFTISNIVYEIPLMPKEWKSECVEGLCDYDDKRAFTDIEAIENGLTIRPSSIAPNWEPYASFFPDNIYLETKDIYLYFDFTSETRWRMRLTLSDGEDTQVIDFQSAIDNIPAGYDGCAGTYCGCVRLADLLLKPVDRVKLERIDISSTWLITASRFDVRRFVFGS